MTPGYWRRPQESEAAFHDGTWFRSGDIATADAAGYVRLVERVKDLISPTARPAARRCWPTSTAGWCTTRSQVRGVRRNAAVQRCGEVA
jgi:hypothetical protein